MHKIRMCNHNPACEAKRDGGRSNPRCGLRRRAGSKQCTPRERLPDVRDLLQLWRIRPSFNRHEAELPVYSLDHLVGAG
jgi:hypothetical protein